MFFKKLIVYQFNNDSTINNLNNEILTKLSFTPCGPLDSIKQGFVSVTDDDLLKLDIQGHSLLKVRTESKIIPSSVIKKKTSERIEHLEQQFGRKVTRSEKQTLKDEVIADLLSVAFTKDQYTYIWINHQDQFIAIETSSFKVAENILSLIRKELGQLSLTPLHTEKPVAPFFKGWVLNDSSPTNFFILNDAVLTDPLESNGKIKLIDENLTADEVKSYLNSGREIKSLSFSYQQRTVFTVNTELVFSKINYSSEMLDENCDISPDDKAKRIEADFYLVANELTKLINDFTRSLQ
ncbi:hypothetical protein A9G13_02215 [Gilliamella sp. wkB178]|uniref:recombination-associated protein RdgC n=1 Tax=Gilliamella sp. wkB178 TaxID=3120259 RepID=UPI00080E7BEF|nr:recombination-associated protein RdgC [Gilliamella apicola]OCG08898.1 hypothetical protein A9G13_02215 [Gilliamella apicola]